MKKRVAELEQSLGEAREREQARDDLEKTQVDRLLALADVVGSKFFRLSAYCAFSRLLTSYGCGFLLIRGLRRCSSRRDFQRECRLGGGCWLRRPRLRVCFGGAAEVDRRLGDCALEHLPQQAIAGCCRRACGSVRRQCDHLGGLHACADGTWLRAHFPATSWSPSRR